MQDRFEEGVKNWYGLVDAVSRGQQVEVESVEDSELSDLEAELEAELGGDELDAVSGPGPATSKAGDDPEPKLENL